MDLNISLSSVKNKRILISPLNWGLGHVMRCIPLIEQLIQNDNEVIVCCDEQQEEVFRTFFPSLWYVSHSGYPFVFGGNGNWEGDLIRAFKQLRRRLQEERAEVEKYISIFNPDYILSDQRYGFRSKRVPSIFITHQLALPVSGFFRFGQLLNQFYIKKFNSVWVFDSFQHSLAGKLSQGGRFYTRLGILSRFKQSDSRGSQFKFTAIISGPKPYSEDFFEEIKEKLILLSQPCVIISNTDHAKTSFKKLRNCTVLVNPSHVKMQEVLGLSEYIISRAGYTTLMDLTMLDKKALLIPTKGQKEQLYLADFHCKHPKWKFYSEEDFSKLDLSHF